MTKIPLGTSDWRRADADEPDILVRNRYFEQNPANQEDQVAFLSRPGLKKFLEVGNGPIKAIYSQPGCFDDALFVVSGSTLYRVDTDETITTIGTLAGGLRDTPSITATANIETVPAYLFVADGSVLYRYEENGHARGTLTASGAIATGDKIKINTTYYQWTSGSVNAGTPDGSTANPWLVALGSSNTDALDNMRLAINADGTAGTTYSSALTAHTTAEAEGSTSTILVVRAITAGSGGNTIATTVEVGANIAWGGATLSGGGSATFTQVIVPDGLGIISVATTASYVICVVAQGEDVNGRFYWIEPGETSIDPLNFATAELSPDALNSVRAVGDQFWLLGKDSTEVWYATGDTTAPFARVQGRLFDRGTWDGTDVVIKDSLIVVDNDGVVYRIDSSPEPISTNAIEERIRKAMIEQIKHL